MESILEAKSDESPADPASLLLDVRQVARLLVCSVRHVYALADAGRIPRPFKLGTLNRWPRATIEAWVNGGCKAPR
jgi:excisionase family DNA binding protein